MRILKFINKYYQPDPRAISLMRIAIALVVITDILIRCGDIEALYSNTGMWPSNLIHNFGWQKGFWSIHSLSNSPAWVILLFCLHLSFALFLLIGFQSQLSTLLLWLLYISLHNRNLFVLQAGDDLLRITLFWGLFMGWGSHYSHDASHKKKIFSVPLAGLAYLISVASVYLFTVLLKTGNDWIPDGSAIYYALALDQIRLPITGDFLYEYPFLMTCFTYGVYAIEVIIPILILWPFKNEKYRWMAFLSILILHLSIGLTLFVGLFYMISIAAGIGLIPVNKMNVFDKFFKKHSDPTLVNSTPPIALTIFSLLVLMLTLLNLAINFSSLPYFNYKLKKELLMPVNVLRMNQYWGMFSPGILKKDGWLVYHGIDQQGRQWDLDKNEDYVDYQKPEHVVSMYKNDRWRKLAENMQRDEFLFLRHLYSNYYLKQWNKNHPEKQMATLNLFFMEQENIGLYKKTEPKKILYCVSTSP